VSFEKLKESDKKIVKKELDNMIKKYYEFEKLLLIEKEKSMQYKQNRKAIEENKKKVEETIKSTMQQVELQSIQRSNGDKFEIKKVSGKKPLLLSDIKAVLEEVIPDKKTREKILEEISNKRKKSFTYKIKKFAPKKDKASIII
jgi:hypothetical protein